MNTQPACDSGSLFSVENFCREYRFNLIFVEVRSPGQAGRLKRTKNDRHITFWYATLGLLRRMQSATYEIDRRRVEANSYIGEFEVASVVRRSCVGFAVALSLLVTAALVGKLVYPIKPLYCV